jgi:hypothetical protein
MSRAEHGLTQCADRPAYFMVPCLSRPDGFIPRSAPDERRDQGQHLTGLPFSRRCSSTAEHLFRKQETTGQHRSSAPLHAGRFSNPTSPVNLTNAGQHRSPAPLTITLSPSVLREGRSGSRAVPTRGGRELSSCSSSMKFRASPCEGEDHRENRCYATISPSRVTLNWGICRQRRIAASCS